MSAVMAETNNPAPPVMSEDPYSLVTLADPFPFQKMLRDTAPVVELGKYGVYAAGRHEALRAIMANWQDFLSGGGVGMQDIRQPGKFRIPSAIVEADPPSHTAVRSVLMKVLSPLKIRQWRATFEAQAVRLADEVVAKGDFDGVTEVAESFIFKVFPDAMGLMIPRHEALTVAEMRFNQTGPHNDLYHAAMKKAEPYLDWYDRSCRREAALPGGVAEEVFQAEESGLLAPGVGSNIVRTLVGGGTDTTISGIGFTLKLLAENPDQWAMLKANPALARGAFEETLRLESPQQIVYRTTARNVDFHGCRLKGDTKLAMFLGAGGRDPERWPDPDRFDITRETTGQHVGFGHSIHLCIGQMLARLEAETILQAIVKRVDSLSIDGQPEYRLMNQVRALRKLPLRVVAS